MKLQIRPPTFVNTEFFHATRVPQGFCTARGLVEEVAGEYRFRRSLISEVQRELIRFFALNSRPVYFALRGAAAPCPLFERHAANQWLEESGGRTWLVSELEARSNRRVIAFPSKRGGDR